MKIFITGSESFVGRELKKHCQARNIAFAGVDMAPTSEKECHQIDIRSPEVDRVIPEGTDALVHLAAISRDQDCRKDTQTALDVNVGGTLNLMRAAQARGVKQFIFASSEWVYGNSKPGEIQKEDDPIDANRITSEYALTKIAGERFLSMAHQRGFCPTTILRFGIIYGPRPKPQSAVEGIFNEVRTLDKIEMKGSLSSGRRFIHVSDIADGILSAVGRTAFEVFNLSGDRLVTFREIIETSSRLLGKKPVVVETDPQSINIRNPDNAKVKQALGWSPKLNLEQGLQTLSMG